MPRRPNTSPTHIYWLIDIRPEVIAAGWSSGQPFYCGKSVRPEKRFAQHKYLAVHGSHGQVGKRVEDCNGFVRMQIMEIVPVGISWTERERHWIKLLRHAFPAVNIADGGGGTLGWTPSTVAREKIGAAQRGKIVSEETRAKIRAARAQQITTNETRAKLSRRFRGKRRPEISAALMGRQVTEETRNKISQSLSGKQHTDERRANISAATIGKKRPPRSPEHCANIAKSKRLWWVAKKAAANV